MNTSSGRGPFPSRRGFTFMEVTVAVVILVVGLLPVYSIMSGGAKRARYNKIRAFAATLAQNFVERLRGYALTHLDDQYGEASWKTSMAALMATDRILVPRQGSDPRVPADPEMKLLLDRWNKRRDLYTLQMLPVKPSYGGGKLQELGARKVRLIGIKIGWWRHDGEKDPFPTEPEQLDVGTRKLSLICFAGEGLFHPPPVN